MPSSNGTSNPVLFQLDFLNIILIPVIDSGVVKTSHHRIGRNLRLVLLLIMLAAQGIANSHELGAQHSFDSPLCSICVLGHGLGAAVTSQAYAPQLQINPTPASVGLTATPLSARYSHYHSRAPPIAL